MSRIRTFYELDAIISSRVVVPPFTTRSGITRNNIQRPGAERGSVILQADEIAEPIPWLCSEIRER